MTPDRRLAFEAAKTANPRHHDGTAGSDHLQRRASSQTRKGRCSAFKCCLLSPLIAYLLRKQAVARQGADQNSCQSSFATAAAELPPKARATLPIMRGAGDSTGRAISRATTTGLATVLSTLK
ncbi:hypothetical protein D9M70_612270 [compost metagenome]